MKGKVNEGIINDRTGIARQRRKRNIRGQTGRESGRQASRHREGRRKGGG